MTKLTKNQRATVVRLFASGTSINNLAYSYGVSPERIEQVIRDAMTAPTAPAVVCPSVGMVDAS